MARAAGHQSAGVEEARVPRDLELTVDEEPTSSHDTFVPGDSAQDREELACSRTEDDIARLEEAARSLDVDEAPSTAVQHGARRHGE